MRIAAFVALALFAAPARAQMGGACMMTELTKLCGAPGSPEFQACAKDKSGDAAAACQGGGAAAPKSGADKNPCADDMKKYCPGMWPGTPEFQSCMSSHINDVTPACAEFGRKQMGKHQGKMKPADAACVSDAKKLCPGLTGTDGPKFMGCMTKHYEELSPLCQKQFKGAKNGKDGDTVDCMKALQTACPDAEMGSPEMTKCMIAHRDDLPPACRKKKGK